MAENSFPTLRVGMPSSTLRVVFSQPEPRNMGRSRYKFGEAESPHFLTCTVVGWLPVFTRPETVQILLDSWQFLQDRNRMELLGYVVLENHIHFIASAENLPKEVGDFKSYTARRVIDYLNVPNMVPAPVVIAPATGNEQSN